jgi:hypothetical protein
VYLTVFKNLPSLIVRLTKPILSVLPLAPGPGLILSNLIFENSREQIIKENEAMGNGHLNGVTTAPWGIVSIKPQDVDHELPMQVISNLQTFDYIIGKRTYFIGDSC